MLGTTGLAYLFKELHIDILPCNDTAVNIWAFKSLRDDRNGVDIRCLSTYYIAESHNNHC
jgi:hypothetical protein